MIDFLSLARGSAEEARVPFRASLYRGASSRAYFGMFDIARALLASRGHEPDETKTHKTVLRLFWEEFVRDGPFSADDGRALHRAEEGRHLADYQGEATRDEAAQVIAKLEAFIRKAEQVLAGSSSKGDQS